jgi:hypothetical protein
MNPAPLFCPWEPRNPGRYGDLSHEETDPFQTVDELTARDIQWRTTIRVASLGLEDMQQFLRLSLESLGSSSRVDQGTCLPDPSVGLSWMKETTEERPNRERRREYFPPSDRSRTGGHQGSRRWIRLLGITGSEILVRVDRVYVTSNPGPVSVDQVALAGRVGGTDFSNELVLSSFPYLQLSPPHCYTCFC